MKGYLLDTNIISELRKGVRMDPHVSNWYAKRNRHELYLSVITLAEIRRGILLLAKRDKKQASVLAAWCNTVQREYQQAGHLLPVRIAEAEAWAEFESVRSLPVMDAFLAATAKAHDLVLATRNISDFKGLAVNVVNPFVAVP